MREIVCEENFASSNVFKQLEKMDFGNPRCSPLINGGCGMGKTTALVSKEIYDLFRRKTGKDQPQVLLIESRAVTRDQQRLKNENTNYTFLQFEVAAKQDLHRYDIIIIDEAHSLFTDSEYATRSTAPLCEWLRDKCTAFQIYITASDIEFIQFAEKYFLEKEFVLTYPDLEKANVRFLAQEMVLSINTKKTKDVIAAKENLFFQKGKRGLFFVWSAAEASELYRYYASLGYHCGFYISQHNSTQIVRKETPPEEEDDDIISYTSHYVQISVFDLYQFMEKERQKAGLCTVKESLLQGRIPHDIDFLFMTSVGQEGISLSSDNNLDYIFIEDTYPLTVNQKIFRYRDNVPVVYLSLPQRRLEKMFIKTIQQLEDMQTWGQDRLRGFYEGSRKDKQGYGRIIWKDANGTYKIAENYIAYVLTASQQFREIRDNKNNFEFLRETYGQYANKFRIENITEETTKKQVAQCIEPFVGKEIRKKEAEELTEKIKRETSLTNVKQKKIFSFQFVKTYCEKNQICKIKSIRKKINGKRETVYQVLPFLEKGG